MGKRCDDPLVSHLQHLGYCSVLLPKAHYGPLQLLMDGGRELTWLGHLTDVFVPGEGVEPPGVSREGHAASISGKSSGKVSLGVGLTILSGIIGALGGTPIKLRALYKQASWIAFTFPEVLVDHASPAQLSTFISRSDVDPGNEPVRRLLEADDVYVVTEVIKAREFQVEAYTERGAGVELDVPVVQQAVGGSLEVSGERERTTTLSYKGGTPLAFGFQAIRLVFTQGRFRAFEALAPGGEALRGGVRGEAERYELLRPEGAFLRLRG